MPRQNIDYSKAVIYKIYNSVDPTITEHYIGSSSNFSRRKARHHYNSKTPTASEYNYNVYQFIRNNGGWKDWKMEVIENYICETRKELNEREKHYILNRHNLLNKKCVR